MQMTLTCVVCGAKLYSNSIKTEKHKCIRPISQKIVVKIAGPTVSQR